MQNKKHLGDVSDTKQEGNITIPSIILGRVEFKRVLIMSTAAPMQQTLFNHPANHLLVMRFCEVSQMTVKKYSCVCLDTPIS